MPIQPTLFPAPDDRSGRHRTGDHPTSVEGAHDVSVRAGTQKYALLTSYILAGMPLTDEEAAGEAGLLRSNYWKRCGELRQDRLIQILYDHERGEIVTRQGAAGVSRIVCDVTELGKAVWREGWPNKNTPLGR